MFKRVNILTREDALLTRAASLEVAYFHRLRDLHNRRTQKGIFSSIGHHLILMLPVFVSLCPTIKVQNTLNELIRELTISEDDTDNTGTHYLDP